MQQRYYSPNHKVEPNGQSTHAQKSKQAHLRRSVSGMRIPDGPKFFAQEKRIGAYVYDISKEIGKGFSSIVYRGVHGRTRSQCAVKVINFKDYSPSSMKMLEDEIKILRSLDHPNIIKCFDVYKTHVKYYLITQYCPQKDLFSFMSKAGRFQQALAVDIMAQIIQGVKHLMSNGIVHRDLKPANILKGENHWKIADFGFAMFSDTPLKSKFNVGTPLYMAPQALVDNIYSSQSDIFSLGIIFYEMLTGRTPWQCQDQKNLIKKIMNEPYNFPENIKTSTGVINVVKSMCAKAVEDRMTRQQFLSLNIVNQSINPQESAKFAKQLKDRKEKEQKVRSLSKKRENLSPTDKLVNRNNHILLSQLHFCRFIYYLIRNMKYLETTPKNKTKLTMVLYHHLEKLINLLANNKTNYFQLDGWHEFKESKKYESTLTTMKEYAERYGKEYEEYLKDIDVNVVQQFNRNFQSLSINETFTTDCFEQILLFVSSLLRQVNHNVNLQTKALKNILSPELKAAIEALKALLKYHSLVDLSLRKFEEFGVFEKECSIRVQVDYTSCDNTIVDYNKLREQLKAI